MYKVITLLIVILLISSCKYNITGSLIKDSDEAKKYTIKEDILNTTNQTKQSPPKIEVKEKDCNQTIKELQDEYLDLQIEIDEIEGKRRILAGEIGYYQDAIYGEEKYKQKLEEFKKVKEEAKKLNDQLNDRVRAIKLLSEKCKIKVKILKAGYD